MKLKFFSLLIFAALLFACSSEESIEIQPQQVVDLENSQEPTGPSYSPLCPECDENYIFPELFSGGLMFRRIEVTFDASATPEEIHCFKFRLFECLYKNKVYEDSGPPPINPLSEYWWISLGKPGGDILNDICNDPLATNEQCYD